MEEILKKIKGLFGKIKFKKTTYEKKGIRPYHDWYIMIMSSLIIIVVAALSAYYLFVQIDQGTLFPVDKATLTRSDSINNNLVNKIIREMDEKENNHADFIQNKTIPADPSL